MVAGAACDVSGVRSGHGFPFISCSCAITGEKNEKAASAAQRCAEGARAAEAGPSTGWHAGKSDTCCLRANVSQREAKTSAASVGALGHITADAIFRFLQDNRILSFLSILSVHSLYYLSLTLPLSFSLSLPL